MELSALEHLKNIVSPGFLRKFYSDLLILADNRIGVISCVVCLDIFLITVSISELLAFEQHNSFSFHKRSRQHLT